MISAFKKARQIANAVLYEGYMLYPYRASSTKNQRRETFGTLYPEQHPNVLSGIERCRNEVQCIAVGSASSLVAVRVCFLQMITRVLELKGTHENISMPDEAIERTVDLELDLREILGRPRIVAFEFPPSVSISEPLGSDSDQRGRIRKTQLPISGRLRISAERIDQGDAFRVTVEVFNSTAYAGGSTSPALLSSFVSAHTILGIRNGEFISLLDSPRDLRAAAASCNNVGLFPVLVGEPGEHDVMLASPIILYDYPQVAPESAGDFFDATEMDEMLTLRVMTLTDEEKSEMRNSDERVRELLERTEATAREQLRRTHGIIRDLRPSKDNAA